MTASQIAKLLADRADDVCQHLLPNGKRVGHDWCAGSVHGEAGSSLKVSLTGSKQGIWADFANVTEHSGDLLDLWCAARSCSLSEAMSQAKSYLGIQNNTFEVDGRKTTFTRPEKPKVGRPRDTELAYLASRGLRQESIDAYKLAAANGEICFPYLRCGELIAAKYLKAERENGKKAMRMEKGCEPCLFGWQAIPPTAREVVITEGELDAVSMWQMGRPALSVPNGAQGHSWIEYEFDNLERFDTIYLCFDNDEPGQNGAKEVANRLGAHRCRLVQIPKTAKDANDLLRAGLGPIEIAVLFDKASTFDPVELRSAAYFVDEVIAEFNGGDTGFYTPWAKIGGDFRFREGEVSVIGGVRSHGKSEAVGHITLEVMAQGGRCCVASMEFLPRKWLKRLTRQCAAAKDPSEPYIRAIHSWYEGKLWAFAASGTTKANRLLEIFEYARKRYDVRFFVIDNLAKCGFKEDDYNGQKDFMDKLTDFARDNSVHVVLVHHMRKGDYRSGPGDDMAFKGTGALLDMADSAIVWWRDKDKEDKRRNANLAGEAFDNGASPDAIFKCQKQRNGEDEPAAGLWFDPVSHQFVESPTGRAKHYVKWSADASYMVAK